MNVVILSGYLPADAVMRTSPSGWRKLTWRWGLFFIVLAVLNEAVWRTQSTDFWVAFKVWGIMPLTVVFSAAQLPMLSRHAIDTDGAAASDT